MAAASWVTMYAAASTGAIRRVIRNPKVTAGLKWPPEMCPTAEAITAITSPCANATPTSPAPTAIAPTPMKIRANVPTNSATRRRPASCSIARPLSRRHRTAPRARKGVLLAWPDERSARRAALRGDLPALPQAVRGAAHRGRRGPPPRVQVPALPALRPARPSGRSRLELAHAHAATRPDEPWPGSDPCHVRTGHVQCQTLSDPAPDQDQPGPAAIGRAGSPRAPSRGTAHPARHDTPVR